MTAPQLEQMTGTPASTWRYWAHIGQGPPSFKIGRRRVWKRVLVLKWIAEQEAAAAPGDLTVDDDNPVTAIREPLVAPAAGRGP